MATDVQATLDKADSAIQSADLGALASKDQVEYADLNQDLQDYFEGIEGRIGDLDRLSTEAQGDLASAINEVYDMVSGNISAIEDLQMNDHFHNNKDQLDTYDKTQTELLAAADATAKSYVDGLENGQVKTNKESIGTLTNLETSAKSDLVTAINEVYAYADGNASDIGTLQDKVQALESVSYVEITADEIDAMFEA